MQTWGLRFAPPQRRIGAVLAVALLWSGCTRDEGPFTAPQGTISASRQTKPFAPIPGQYIVVLKEDVHDVHSTAQRLALKHGGKVGYVYTAALKGFSVKIPDAAATALSTDPAVAYVEQDQVVRPATGQPNTTWGLQRISQSQSIPPGSNPLSYTYTYNYFADGTGVTVYIIDSGIYISDSDFGGRASVGYDALGGNGIDCFGHGTHVAGTVGGATWGVAKNVRLVAVRVFDCNGHQGSSSATIAGVDWVTANRVLPAVANMSLEGSSSSSLIEAVENSINLGYVTYVVAAGNDATDACSVSPANAPDAMTVGATDIGDNFATSFSNFGNCVKINAPGVDVTSDWLNGGTKVYSGTSMASPHVAGTAALYLSVNTTTAPAQVRGTLAFNASYGFIHSLPPNTPNAIDYSAFIVNNPPSSVTAGGGVDSTATCGPYGFGGNEVCDGAILGILASSGNTITLRYKDSSPGGARHASTLILSGATASGGVDSTATCGPYGFGGTQVCNGAILGVVASGGNTISLIYKDSSPGGARHMSTLTLSGATASGGVDSTATCGPYGFGGSQVCNGAILGVVASGGNTITVRYKDSSPGGGRHTSALTLSH